MKRGFVFCMFLVLLCGFTGDGNASSWDGRWDSSLGTMQINQTGSRVEGTYGSNGRFEGTVDGDVLKGSYWWSNKTGDFELRMNTDGRSFTGDWSRSGASGKWTGTRVGAPDTHTGPSEPSPDPEERVRRLGNGLTEYTIWSVDQDSNNDTSGQQLNMGAHSYCALTYVMSGGFNSACGITVRGDDWILVARDPGPPDPHTGESQGCSAICFDR